MDASSVPPLPVGSPWAGWAPPNLKWCEENLAGWIAAPANTWSNLAYFLVAYLIWRHARTTGGGPRALVWLAPAMAAMGAGSFLYHASYTFVFQVADFVGMYLVLWLFIAINLRRAGIATVRTQTMWYVGGVSACTAILFVMARLHLPYQSLILMLAVTLGVQEVSLRSRSPHAAYRELALAWSLLAAAFACSAADLAHVWCDPHNHWLQGHACWHLLSAAGLYRGYLFYASLDGD